MQKITPHLWFDKEAKEAAELYTSAFQNSNITNVTTLHNTPSGDTDIVSFVLSGQAFMAISAGPLFEFNPSVSFLVACKSKEEVDALWNRLAEGGAALMPLDSYPFSERYGWLRDKYNLSWQIMYFGDREITQKITPTLMFVGKVRGKAEEAIHFYLAVFKNAKIGHILRYGKGEEPDKEGTVKHAAFTLEGRQFAAMDSAADTGSRSTKPFPSCSTATRKRRLTTTGKNSPRCPQPSSAAGSKTGTASPGRLFREGWTR